MPGGTLIISGFFVDDVPDMQEVATLNKLFTIKTFEKNNWAVIVLRKA